MHDPCYNVWDIKCTTYIHISFFLMSHRTTLQVSMVDSKKKWKIYKCKVGGHLISTTDNMSDARYSPIWSLHRVLIVHFLSWFHRRYRSFGKYWVYIVSTSSPLYVLSIVEIVDHRKLADIDLHRFWIIPLAYMVDIAMLTVIESTWCLNRSLSILLRCRNRQHRNVGLHLVFMYIVSISSLYRSPSRFLSMPWNIWPVWSTICSYSTLQKYIITIDL